MCSTHARVCLVPFSVVSPEANMLGFCAPSTELPESL